MDITFPVLVVKRKKSSSLFVEENNFLDSAMLPKIKKCFQVIIHKGKNMFLFMNEFWPGSIAQSIGHLTRKSEVLCSIPGLATYFRFSFC